MTRKAAAQTTETFTGKLGPGGIIAVGGMALIGLVGLALAAEDIGLIFYGSIAIWIGLLFVALGFAIAAIAAFQVRQVLLAAGAAYTVTPTALTITRRHGIRNESLPWATFTRVSRETRPSLRPSGIILETADRRIMIHGLTLTGSRMQALYEAICAHVPARARG